MSQGAAGEPSWGVNIKRRSGKGAKEVQGRGQKAAGLGAKLDGAKKGIFRGKVGAQHPMKLGVAAMSRVLRIQRLQVMAVKLQSGKKAGETKSVQGLSDLGKLKKAALGEPIGIARKIDLHLGKKRAAGKGLLESEQSARGHQRAQLRLGGHQGRLVSFGAIERAKNVGEGGDGGHGKPRAIILAQSAR